MNYKEEEIENNKMNYTEEEIEKYLKILKSYKNNQSENKENKENKFRCSNCQNDSFTIELGQNVCEECGVVNGHVLGYFDIKEQDRFHFKKKSIYNRKYHYEKKVDQISKRLHLTDDEKCQLYSKLMNIDNNVMEILNKQFCRKRMINIFYLIKKLLQEMGCEKYQLVYLKISPQTFENYEKWWNSYKSLNNTN